MRYVDGIFVQTEKQSNMLKSLFQRKASILSNPITFWEAFKTEEYKDSLSRDYVLWIGRTEFNGKRPLRCLELARRLPHIKFLMLLNNSDNEMFEDILRNKTENITVIERISDNQMESIYQKAKAFISTSLFEGMPNAFLQAEVFEVPILSLDVAPDKMCSKWNAIFCANGSMDLLVSMLNKILVDKSLNKKYVENMIFFLKKNHNN